MPLCPTAPDSRIRFRRARAVSGALSLLVVLAVPALAAAQPAAASKDVIARGKYVFGVAAGCGCHTEPDKAATLLNAGGRKYEGPFGTVYSTNITPDPETGIGKWTDEQIITAVRAGRRPNGERLVPVHPYPTFNGMAEEDLRALVAYLRSVPPVRRANTPKKITVPMFESVFLPAWLAAFAPRETPPPTAPTSGVARGEYLVRAVGHCGECHTPRGMTQALDNSRFLAGNQKNRGPEGKEVPNITPDKASGLMGEVIQGSSVGFKDLTKADRLAIARYLKAIPAVKNKIGD